MLLFSLFSSFGVPAKEWKSLSEEAKRNFADSCKGRTPPATCDRKAVIKKGDGKEVFLFSFFLVVREFTLRSSETNHFFSTLPYIIPRYCMIHTRAESSGEVATLHTFYHLPASDYYN